MTFTDIARLQWEAYQKGLAPEGGMAKFEELQKLSLDGTLDSLDRLDCLLMELHQKGYAEEMDLDEEEEQNFLYFVAFYLGKVASGELGIEPNWISWEVLMEANPSMKDAIPDVFGTSVLCVLGKTLYIPLSVVMARLYEGEEGESSVRANVEEMVARCRETKT